MDFEKIYYKMLLIRKTERKIEEAFSTGIFRGTTHGCIGEEAVPVALSELLDLDKDYLCGGHRAHGLAVAFSGKPELLFSEIMGKECGFAKGMGGSQHIYYKNFFTNGITGGMVPVTTGIAYTIKHEGTDAVATVCFGDGAMNEGYVMEAFNLAKVFALPVLFVLENNKYAMSTAVEYASSGPFEDRVKGFHLPYSKVESSCFENVYSTLKDAVEYVRKEHKPYFVEVITHRFCGHSKSDKRAYVPAERDAYWHAHDCLDEVRSKLSEATAASVDERVSKQIEESFNYSLNYGV